MITHTTAKLWLLLLFSMVGGIVQASTAAEQEIGHLLNFIASSGCTFIRNDTVYPATEARAHIERKYNYVKSKVKTTEDFIRLAATQSSLSGKPYRVNCAGTETLSKDWLLAELGKYRQAVSHPDKDR